MGARACCKPYAAQHTPSARGLSRSLQPAQGGGDAARWPAGSGCFVPPFELRPVWDGISGQPRRASLCQHGAAKCEQPWRAAWPAWGPLEESVTPQRSGGERLICRWAGRLWGVGGCGDRTIGRGGTPDAVDASDPVFAGRLPLCPNDATPSAAAYRPWS